MRTDSTVDVETTVSVEVTLTAKDIQEIVGGYEIADDNGEVEVTVNYDESPLDYLERTWSEPRYGESTSDHSARLARGVN